MEKQNSNGNGNEIPDLSFREQCAVGAFLGIILMIFAGTAYWLDKEVVNKEVVTVESVKKKIMQTELLIDKFEGMVRIGTENNQPESTILMENSIIEELEKNLVDMKKQLAELNE